MGMGNNLAEIAFGDSNQAEDIDLISPDKVDMEVKLKDKFIGCLMFWSSILQFNV